MADAVGHDSFSVCPAVSRQGRPSRETRPGGRPRGPRTPNDERRPRRGVGIAAPGRRRSEGHQRLERGRLRHDHRRRREDQRGSVYVVRVRAGCRLQRRCGYHPALRALQLEHSWAPGASPQAAAAVAAHDVLLEYFPASQGRLDTALAASLAEIPDGPAKQQGIRYGERAADRLIELRADDGRFAPITFDVPPAPGVWRPTPPAFAPFFDPWMAKMRPLLLDSPSQFRPGPPPAVDLPDIHGGFQRGEGGGFGNEHGPDTGTDRHRALHRREHLPDRQLFAA